MTSIINISLSIVFLNNFSVEENNYTCNSIDYEEVYSNYGYDVEDDVSELINAIDSYCKYLIPNYFEEFQKIRTASDNLIKTLKSNDFKYLNYTSLLAFTIFQDIGVVPNEVKIEATSGFFTTWLLKINYFTHFKFLPGLGFYGFGLIHMIGGLSRTATNALRQLLDAGTFSNMPAGFKQRGIRVRDEAQSIQPGEFRDVDAPGGNIRDAFMPLPFKEPSATLLQLMGIVVQAGQRFAAIADMQVGDGNQQAAVGTTIALLERGSRVMSAIHKRLYVALKQEFTLLAEVFKTYLPPEYPYDVVGGQRNIKVSDFDDKIDILPIADPNIFSQSQRITLAQTELQLAMSNPQMHNLYEAYRDMYTAIGVKDVNRILPPPQQPMPMDPAAENIMAMSGKPFQAFKGQDHRAHITSHLNFMATNMVKNNPMIMGALQKNIFEHISLMADEQVQMEMRDKLVKLQELNQLMQNPQTAENPDIQNEFTRIQLEVESRKAILIAEMTEDFLQEEKRVSGDFGNDPIAKLRARELDLKAQDNMRKEKEDEARINLDRAKMMQNKELTEDKLDQNEELALLRAATSIEKQKMSNRAKAKTDATKRFDVKTLKKGDK